MEIPGLHGLTPLELAKRTIEQFMDDDMATYASALSFRVLLALFPFLIFLLTLLVALGLPDFFSWLLDQAQTALPEDAYQRVEQVVDQVRDQASGGLLSLGIGVALWSASGGVRSLIKALNAAYDVAESRPLWKLFPVSILFTLGLAIMLITATALMLLGPQAIEWLAEQANLGDFATSLWAWLRWPTAVLLLMLAVAIIYSAAPNIDQPFHLVSFGSVFAVVAWIVATYGFSLYVSNFGNYSATYGSLGGVVVLLLYLFVSAATLLLGAEVNSVVHKARHGFPNSVGEAIDH